MHRIWVSKITTTNMSEENACTDAICQSIAVVTLSIANLWFDVLKPDFLSTLWMGIAELYYNSKG